MTPTTEANGVPPGSSVRAEPGGRVAFETVTMFRLAVITCVVLGVAVGVAAAIVPGIEVEGGVLTLLWLGVLFGLVNAILGPILRILTLPLTVITLGLFALVVNGIVLAATAG